MWESDIADWRPEEQGSDTPTRRVRSPQSTENPRPTRIVPATGKSAATPRRRTSGMRKLTAVPSIDAHVTLSTTVVTAPSSEHEAPRDEDREIAPSKTLVLPATRVARRATTARPIRPEDTALVEQATLMLRVVDAVPADPRTLTLANVASGEQSPVTIIPRTADLPAVWEPSTAPKRRQRSAGSTVLMWGLACAVVLTVVSVATPLAGRVFSQRFVPSAARIAVNPSAVPSGPWASVSGAVQTLGIGGGAGPGVKAPGTAGLPVKTPPKQTSAPPRAPSNGISPAPVSPWPPSNPYMYVPGHPAFTVQPNGFYSWAFGQCTWWAQWERRDENLTHMGNAMYWASSAAARGYHVGTTPVAGATVVFQPGVQGAGGAGHVAHVVAVYPDGWFLVSEMNYYWNGGGWGRVDYRFAHMGWGVQFIY